MTVLLKDAIKPNLVQTLEGQPAFVHCGPFANIAHGNNSLVADLVALKLGDYVVTESGFGSDMGMEKFLDIVCRIGGLRPNAICLVTTVRALKHHGGDPDGGVDAVERGAENLRRHLGIVREFGLKAVVAVNRFPTDPDDELEAVRKLALDYGAHAAELNDAFERGGEGAASLAEAIVDAAEQPDDFDFIYPLEAPDRREDRGGVQAGLRRRRRRVPAGRARRSSGRSPSRATTSCRSAWRRRTSRSRTTQALLNAPTGFTVTVRDIRAYTGSGWLVPLLGDMQTMPGLGVKPAAFDVDIDESGTTVGLF